MEKIINRFNSFVIITLVYIAAVFIGYITYKLLENANLLVSIFAADAMATVFVWLMGVVFKNPSMYDPYWSVAPIVIVGFWIYLRGTELILVDILLITAVLLWGIRLTVNWAINFRGMNHIDWRYVMLKKNNKNIWQIVNFFGINMMPTVLVYLALIPAYNMIFFRTNVYPIFYLGFAVAVISLILQYIADKQMKSHRDKKTGSYINEGLWKYSRHPNYFGEMAFWWAIFVMQIGCVHNMHFSVIGAVLITLLFVFISIPMMEKRVIDKYPEYREYQNSVSMVVLWRRKG